MVDLMSSNAPVWLLKDKQGDAYGFHCPACEMIHIIPTSYKKEHMYDHLGRLKPTWPFNGDVYRPTFHRPFKLEWRGHQPPQVCHFVIREGEIIYLIESTHALSGKRMKLEAIE
jgi:hypothetical protein